VLIAWQQSFRSDKQRWLSKSWLSCIFPLRTCSEERLYQDEGRHTWHSLGLVLGLNTEQSYQLFNGKSCATVLQYSYQDTTSSIHSLPHRVTMAPTGLKFTVGSTWTMDQGTFKKDQTQQQKNTGYSPDRKFPQSHVTDERRFPYQNRESRGERADPWTNRDGGQKKMFGCQG